MVVAEQSRTFFFKTGEVPIASGMSWALTGHAVTFNRRHDRHGHLFQNRYKSILCEEDAYLKELVRYLHLNPLRAGLVKNLEVFATCPYSGHSVMMGQKKGSGRTKIWKTSNPATKSP